MVEVGEKFLITTDNWFYAPDGAAYKAVWGTVHAVNDAKQTLGIETNRNATNWYVSIGNMIVAGCQIHYVIKTNNPNFGEVKEFDASSSEVSNQVLPFSRIFNADNPIAR